MFQDCVSKNKKAVYDLMSSHGDRENLLHFTITMKDYDEVIENNINSGQYQAGKFDNVSHAVKIKKSRITYISFLNSSLHSLKTKGCFPLRKIYSSFTRQRP
jgi:hypothetical protein